MKEHQYFVYMMSGGSGVLYIGMSNNLFRRVQQHKQKEIEGFTKQYNLTKLVYFEEFEDVTVAIAREKQLKGWLRKKKVALLEEMNPKWRDLAEEWYESV
jgi:putative endonuclease